MSRNDWLTGHWWTPDPSGPGMVHVVSGEAVLYRGTASEPGWHLFEYRYGTISYPLVVQFKSIEYPHPNPTRIRHRADRYPFPEVIRANIWLVDHGRSTAAREALGQVSYNDWLMADAAIRDAALLWDDSLQPVSRADEFCTQEGFLNGNWHKKSFRRFVWDECIEEYKAQLGNLDRIKQLPTDAFCHQILSRKAPSWRCVPHLEFDANGARKNGETIGLINDTNGMQIGINPPVGQRSPYETFEAIRCRLDDFVGGALISFRTEQYDPSAVDRFHAPSSDRWNARVWKVHPTGFSNLSRSGGTAKRKMAPDQTISSSVDEHQSSIEQQSLYRNALVELEAYEQAFPLCQPLSDQSCNASCQPPDRQVDLKYLPVGGKIAARASIRTSIKATADAPLTEWIQTFGER